MRIKKVLLITLCLILCTQFYAYAIPTEEGDTLSVPDIQQEETKWCWAASSLSILNHFSIYTDQQTFVTYVQTGKTSPINASNEGAYPSDSLKGLDYFGLSGSTYSGSRSFSSVKSQIKGNHPLYADIYWLNDKNKVTGAHAVVIDAYYVDNSNNTQQISYMDPWDACHYSVDYSKFVYTDHVQKWATGIQSISKK